MWHLVGFYSSELMCICVLLREPVFNTATPLVAFMYIVSVHCLGNFNFPMFFEKFFKLRKIFQS